MPSTTAVQRRIQPRHQRRLAAARGAQWQGRSTSCGLGRTRRSLGVDVPSIAVRKLDRARDSHRSGLARPWFPRPVRDALIAATALANGMTLVTRHVVDFSNCGVGLLNPWAACSRCSRRRFGRFVALVSTLLQPPPHGKASAALGRSPATGCAGRTSVARFVSSTCTGRKWQIAFCRPVAALR